MANENAPNSANEVLHNLKEDHDWKYDPVDITTTGGLQRAIKAQWHAIHALADYIDGKATGRTDAEGRPIPADVPRREFRSRFTDSEGDIPPSELPPDADPYRAEPARVA